MQIADFCSERFDSGEVSEREINPHVIVIDRLRNMNDRHTFLVSGQAVLIHLQLVGRLQRVVAADGNQSIDANGPQCFVHSLQRGGFFGIIQMFRSGDLFARIRASRADDDAFFAAGTTQRNLGQVLVMQSFHQRCRRRIFHQIGVAVLDADDFDPIADAGNGASGDHGIGARCRSAGEEQSNSFDSVGHEFDPC